MISGTALKFPVELFDSVKSLDTCQSKGMRITQLMILLTFALWLIWTSVAHRFGEKTISSTLRNMAWDFTLLPFCFGMLVTHWWAPRQDYPRDLWGWGVGLPLMAALLAFDLWWLWMGKPRTPYRWPFWYFLAGLPVGYFYWPQISIHAPW